MSLAGSTVPPAALAARLAALAADREDCLLRDRRRLQRGLAQVRNAVARAAADAVAPPRLAARVAGLEAAFARSRAVVASRRAHAAHLEWPAELPISACRAALAERFARHQVLIVNGATGSGKSTQLPKLCLAAGRGMQGRIGHTQPRRIAARAIAARLAVETATPAGTLVGYAVRFDDTVAEQTAVKVMTDGILLHEIQADPLLLQYDTLIIDEVHERTLNIDFLLGYLHRLLPRRPDLKVIVTSATFDTEVFARFFTNAAVFEVPGRGYPVATRYRPVSSADEDEDERSLEEAIVAAIAELDAEARGDVLVFLPGEREIRAAARRLAAADLPDTEVLELYARVGAARQAYVFTPGAQRRIVFATNVAETSLTVPRVRHVIDSGLARVSRYSPRRKLQQLPIEPIARANADQRRGRCGREGPGICIRLYSEADFVARRAAVEPEIQRTHLAGVILRLQALGISDVGHFPFIDPPAARLLKDAYAVLQEIGALDGARALTPAGRELTRFPVDPRLARVLQASVEFGCLREALTIVAALSIVDPRERPHGLREAADRAHERFADKRSDFLWFVNAWTFASELQALPARKQWRLCRRAFLAVTRLTEWVELRAYLARLAARLGWVENTAAAGYRAVHCALLAGFPTLVAEWQGDRYVGCRDVQFVLHPTSTLARRGVKWILAGDLVETARSYARLAARIDVAWIERAAGHLIKRSHEAPHWDRRRGCARVTEIQRLFGLVLQADRLVDLARVDAGAARTLLIEHGLVDGELGDEPGFLAHNRALVARIQGLEARARRRDLLAPRSALCAFYAARLPAETVSRRDLLRWLRAAPARQSELHMRETDVTGSGLADVPAYLFPDTLDVAGTRCPLRYRFEPGHVEDGVTVSVPLVLLPRLRIADFDRLVPGLLSARIEQMLRGLPKAARRACSPLREFAMAATEAVQQFDDPLDATLARVLGDMTGRRFDAADFDVSRLPPYLAMHIELLDEAGAVSASGRDLEVLRAGRAPAAAAARDAIDWGLTGSSSGGWTFGTVPAVVSVLIGQSRIEGFPALVDCGTRVTLGVYDSPEQAARMHEEGLARLLLFDSGRLLREVERAVATSAGDALLAARFGYRAAPLRYLAQACARRWARAAVAVRDANGYAALRARFDAAVPAELAQAAARLHTLLMHGARLAEHLQAAVAEGVPRATARDLASQLEELLGPALVVAIDRDGAPRHDRYLEAIERRLARSAANPGKDLDKLARLEPLWSRFLRGRELLGDDASETLGEVRTLLEEYRISLFAPELGTRGKITRERLDTALDALGAPP